MISNPVPWPGGAKCAVAFTMDMDADSILHLAHPDRAPRMVSALSMLKYSPQIAVPRILSTYRKFGLKQTFFLPAWCMEQYPETVEAILRDGHELGYHGYIHEHQNELSRDEEHYWLQRSLEVFTSMTGKRPKGARSPLYNFSEHTADLLIEEGFTFDASLMGDDVPYFLETAKGRLTELPSSWALDDWPQFMHSLEFNYLMPIRSPEEAWRTFWAEFEAAWEHGGLWIAVWHPKVSGRLARWSYTERMIEQMLKIGNVWIASLGEIAAHIEKCAELGQYTPRIERLPYYAGRVSPMRPTKPLIARAAE